MKKSHIILLIVTAVMAVCSAYSLAAINQVYKIEFEWYSQYYKQYAGDIRDISDDQWKLGKYPQKMRFQILGSKEEVVKQKNEPGRWNPSIQEFNFNEYIYMYFTLGEADSPEYRIKVSDIAQRGNTVEVKLSMNSPQKEKEEGSNSSPGGIHTYYPEDMIRIHRDMFPVKGRLYFIFKNQNNHPLYEQYYYVK